MAIYAKKLNGKQRKMLIKYESLSGFEPMLQDDLDAGEITFSELWSTNVNWLEAVLYDVLNINTEGSGSFET